MSAVSFERGTNLSVVRFYTSFSGRHGLCSIYSSCHGSVSVAFYICSLGLRAHSNPASGGLRCIASVTFPKQLSSVEANHIITKIAVDSATEEGEEKDLHSCQSGSRKFNDLTPVCVN